jgi:hypothetical protein
MRVRTEDELELSKKLKIDKYPTRKDYQVKEPLFYAILDSYAPLVTRFDGTRDFRAMAEMLACVLERDGTFFATIRRHATNSTLLDTRDGWESVTRTAAAIIVERYSREDRDAGSDELMLSPEQLRERLEASFARVVELAAELESAGETTRGAVKLTLPEAARPQLQEGAVDRLFDTLAREVVFLGEQGEDGGIPEAEKDREVAKRALVRLRIGELRALAEEHDIDSTGSVEVLAERLAENADDDAAAIARMVVGETSDAPEQGLVTSLFPLERTIDVRETVGRFNGLNGNYARIGVARWFICRSAEASSGALVVKGLLRFYRVSPKLDYEEYDLASTPNVADAVASVRAGHPWLEINSRLRADAPALAQLLHRVGKIGLVRPMALGVLVPEGDAQTWARRSVVMLGLLAHDLSNDGIEVTNVAIAQFETVDDDPASKRAPSVKNVRVGGQHLMSHRQVCELLVGGRALTRIQGSVRVTLSPQQRVITPFRIEIEGEHATVYTGFTATTTSAETSAVHRRLIECVQRAISRTEVPAAATAQIPAIVRRASEASPDEADIIPPPSN